MPPGPPMRPLGLVAAASTPAFPVMLKAADAKAEFAVFVLTASFKTLFPMGNCIYPSPLLVGLKGLAARRAKEQRGCLDRQTNDLTLKCPSLCMAGPQRTVGGSKHGSACPTEMQEAVRWGRACFDLLSGRMQRRLLCSYAIWNRL